MVEEEIQSIYLNETIMLKIYKPEKFSELYKYHLCIMQDGNDYYQIGRIARLSDELHRSGDIERTIFIGIHHADKADRWKKYHPDGDRKSTRLNSSHVPSSYAVFCLTKKKDKQPARRPH